MFVGASDVYAGSARRAFSAGRETYFLAVAGLDQAATIPSDRCFTLEAHALARYLPKIPPALRAQTTALQAGYIAYYRGLVRRAPRDAVCLVDTGRSDNGASCGITAAQIEENEPPDDENGVFVSVVPDGVASVTLSFPAARGKPAHSLTGRVRGNVYAIRATGPAQPLVEPAITWRSADGRVLKTIPMPTPAMERAACRADPVPCALIQDGGLTESSSTTSSGTALSRPEPPAPATRPAPPPANQCRATPKPCANNSCGAGCPFRGPRDTDPHRRQLGTSRERGPQKGRQRSPRQRSYQR